MKTATATSIFTALAVTVLSFFGVATTLAQDEVKPQPLIIDVQVEESATEGGEGTVKTSGHAIFMDAQGNIVEKRFGDDTGATFEMLELSGIRPGEKLSPRDIEKNHERMRKYIEEQRTRQSKKQQEQLGFSDDEWEVIEAKIAEVREKKTALQMYDSGKQGGSVNRMSLFGNKAVTLQKGNASDKASEKVDGKASATKPAEPAEASGPQQEINALRQTLNDENADSDAIRKAVEQLRDGRKRAQMELNIARKDLSELVTARQEAQLILMGILE